MTLNILRIYNRLLQKYSIAVIITGMSITIMNYYESIYNFIIEKPAGKNVHYVTAMTFCKIIPKSVWLKFLFVLCKAPYKVNILLFS